MKSKSKSWTLKDMLITASIGTVFTVLYIVWVQLWLSVQAILGPLSMDILFGVWFLASPVAAFIVRKPFAGFYAEVITGIVQLLLGTASGAIIILTAVIQGLGAEVPLILTKWKKYKKVQAVLMGACASIFSFIYTWFRFNYASLDFDLVVTMFILRVLSGMFLGGLLGHYIVEKLKEMKVVKMAF